MRIKNTEKEEAKQKQPRSTLTSKLELEIELLQRHIQMLKAVMENQPIGIIRLSVLTKFPHHRVRYSLRILEQEGLIVPTPDGAKTTEKLNHFRGVLNSILNDLSETVKEIQEAIEK